MANPERPSMAKEYAGKGLKYSGVVIGILGLFSLSIPATAIGVGAAWYGSKVEEKNKQR